MTTSLHTKTNIAESTGSSAVENQNIEEILDFFDDDDDVEFENKLAELSDQDTFRTKYEEQGEGTIRDCTGRITILKRIDCKKLEDSKGMVKDG